MKKLALSLVLVSSLGFAQAKKVFKSNVEWWGNKTTLLKEEGHNGNIKVRTGVLNLKNGKLVGGDILLDMRTINSTDMTGEYKVKLDDHLKNGDFFEVEKYPVARYTITSVTPSKKAGFNSELIGNMTIKNKTKIVNVPANVTIDRGVVSIVTDRISLNRQDYGVNYKSSMKDVVIKDNMDFRVTLKAK